VAPEKSLMSLGFFVTTPPLRGGFENFHLGGVVIKLGVSPAVGAGKFLFNRLLKNIFDRVTKNKKIVGSVNRY